MRALETKEMDVVAGGGTPGLVCSVSGDASHSEQICQTSSGLTIITTKDTIDVGGGIGITGKIKDTNTSLSRHRLLGRRPELIFSISAVALAAGQALSAPYLTTVEGAQNKLTKMNHYSFINT